MADGTFAIKVIISV